MWTLIICAYLTASGCGTEMAHLHSTRLYCLNALETLRFSRPASDDEAPTIAYCVEGNLTDLSDTCPSGNRRTGPQC